MSDLDSASPELRALWDANREFMRQIADLRDVVVREFGGHTDIEGAVGGAIRIMREQQAELERLRGTGKTMRKGETVAEFCDRIARDNPKFKKRVVFGRAEA